MTATESRMGGMAPRKREKPKLNRRTMRGRFVANLDKIAGDIHTADLAAKWGVSVDMVRKYMRGSNMPDIDDLPSFAKKIGVDDWRQLFE